MSQTKVAVGMLSATGTPGSGNFLRGDGTWNTPSSALTFISNTDISSAATYNFTGFTAASYEHYQFHLQNLIPVTDAVHLWCRTSTDGGSSYDSGGSDYDWVNAFGSSYTASYYTNIDHADSEIALTGANTDANATVGSDTNEHGVSGIINLYGPHTTSYTHITAQLVIDGANTGYTARHSCSAKRISAADVDGFQILFSSGNIESGTITAYGLANS